MSSLPVSLSVQTDVVPLPFSPCLVHLGGRLAMLIKNYNLHENDKEKREETDRVCPQPNPFCLSTFDLNSSRNTGSTVLGNIEKVSGGNVRHGLWLLYKCSLAMHHNILQSPPPSCTPRGSLHLSGSYRFFSFFFFPPFFLLLLNMLDSQLISFSKTQ